MIKKEKKEGAQTAAPGKSKLDSESIKTNLTTLQYEIIQAIGRGDYSYLVDVGGLDACILVGFPGSMMATWQRSGRVGREGRESITALDARLHGGWGISITWSDGHDTGVYGWDLLRRRWETDGS